MMPNAIPNTLNAPPLEVWAGVECTVNRVGDRIYDQLARSGHAHRDEDLNLIAALGVTTLRYPVLWERTAPGSLEAADWRWPDARLVELRELGIQAIVGLVHHGSGPVHTSLVDDAFPVQLARYAGAVAMRYPWVTDYTPVNEPLTTARFAGLYGHWYPHGRDDLTFARCLLAQCKATVLAMQAIREVTPHARLVFTEELGATYSTAPLRYQAEFENARRWLSLDLVCGRVDHLHPLRGWLRAIGIADRELDWFRGRPCPPDLIGCNYYVTSERYLDHDLASWPVHCHGGNHQQRYADVAAVHARGLSGIKRLLHDIHDRFGLPMAITEAHLGCTREQQLRWLLELHDGATRARAAGLPVRAVTAWALFGSFNWHNLVTRDEDVYEPGVFDIRGPRPRTTALAGVVRDLAAGRRPRHPVIAGPGWWQDLRISQEAA
jgi:dTDP-4-dehydrorhamnose reductase